MTLKDDWETGDVFTAADANDVADAVNTLTSASTNVLTPEQFGAVGDGATDDTAALTAMFETADTAGGATILIPDGKTYATDWQVVYSNTFVYGSGTLKCLHDGGRATDPPGAFISFSYGVTDVTWIGPTLDVNGKTNANGFDIGNGDYDEESGFVENIYIAARVKGSRIDTSLEDDNDHLFRGGGKGIVIGFRARNIYANVRTDDCDIGCSLEATENLDRWLENVLVDLQCYDSHRTALFVSGTLDSGVSGGSLESGGFLHARYPGVKIRLRAYGGQDDSVTDPVTAAVYDNCDAVGVVTFDYASGIDLEMTAAVSEPCTLIRGVAVASNIKVTNALLTELEDGWNTNYPPTLSPGLTYMPDNVFEANIHATTHSGVIVRPHRVSGTKAVVKTRIDVNMWVENGVGDITQSDGSTDGFGTSCWYRFSDMRTSPVKEVVGISSYASVPVWWTRRHFDALGAVVFVPDVASTATASGTTTLTIADKQVQEFVGSAIQTVKLPTTSVTAGQQYTVVNNSSDTVTVQSSGGNTITTVTTGTLKLFVAQTAEPAAAADWRAI